LAHHALEVINMGWTQTGIL